VHHVGRYPHRERPLLTWACSARAKLAGNAHLARKKMKLVEWVQLDKPDMKHVVLAVHSRTGVALIPLDTELIRMTAPASDVADGNIEGGSRAWDRKREAPPEAWGGDSCGPQPPPPHTTPWVFKKATPRSLQGGELAWL
jgi:hypothetical protein